MSYLTCPNCRFTVFDRTPLAPSRSCPRCLARSGSVIELVHTQQRFTPAPMLEGWSGADRPRAQRPARGA